MSPREWPTPRLEEGLRLRFIRPDDEPRLIALHERLSQHTAYQRFFTALRRLPPAGIRRFRAYVLADNSRMLRLLSRYTRVLERKVEAGVVDLLLECHG